MSVSKRLFDELRSLADSTEFDSWLAKGVREDIHLDFKRKDDASSATPNDADKKTLSKALSAFANADGGVLVWGIDAPNTSPSLTKVPLSTPRQFAAHLDSLGSRLVVPPVLGFENHAIVLADGTGYVCSHIPRSLHSPHRAEAAGVKRYYMRNGESSIELEHYQLEYMFGRRQVPLLELTYQVRGEGSITSGGHEPTYMRTIRLALRNVGVAVAKHACLRLNYKIPGRYTVEVSRILRDFPLTGPERSRLGEPWRVATIRAGTAYVIYPDDEMHFVDISYRYGPSEAAVEGLPDLEVRYEIFGEDLVAVRDKVLLLKSRELTSETGSTP